MIVALFTCLGVALVLPAQRLSPRVSSPGMLALIVIAAMLLGAVQQRCRLSLWQLLVSTYLTIFFLAVGLTIIDGPRSPQTVFVPFLICLFALIYLPAFFTAARGVIALGRARRGSIIDRVDRISCLSAGSALAATTMIAILIDRRRVFSSPELVSLHLLPFLSLVVREHAYHRLLHLTKATHPDGKICDVGIGDDVRVRSAEPISYRTASSCEVLSYGNLADARRALFGGLWGDLVALMLCNAALWLRTLSLR